MSRRLVALSACLIALSLALASPVLAQLQGARIVGTIYDPQHAGIPSVTVTVTNVATNVARTAATDREGNYVVTPLDPGIYRVTAAVTGFQTTVRENVELTVGQAARVELVLAIGALSSEVLVTTQAPLLNTESATLSQVITKDQIVDLPLNGRSFHELARLTPGVALLAPSGNSQMVRPEIVNGNIMGGVSGRQTRFLLDGVDITEEHQGGTWIQTSVDALQEFSVQQNAYSAEFHGAGGTFNVVTKSGSNRVRRQRLRVLAQRRIRLEELLRADQRAARTESVRRHVRRTGRDSRPGQWPRPDVLLRELRRAAAQVGRSGRRDRAVVGAAPGQFSGPRADLRSADHHREHADRVCGQRDSAEPHCPGGEFFMRYIPLPNGPNNTWVSSPIVEFNQDQFTLRGDHELSPRHKLFVRFSRHSNHEDRPSTFPALGATELWGPAYNLAGALTSNFGSLGRPRAPGEPDVRRVSIDGVLPGEGSDLLAQAGVKGLEQAQDPAIASLPAFSFSGYAGFSGNAGDGRPKWQNRGEWEITDNVTWVKSRHILKFGGRAYHRKILFTDARDHNGTYGFTGVMTQNPASAAGTGDGFADFLLGYPANSTRSNPATWWGGYGTYWHGFLQDDFKVSNALTLNLGFRYEYTPWLTGYKGQAAAFDPTREKSIIVSSKTNDIDLSVQRLADVGYTLFSDLIQTSSQAGRAAEHHEERQEADRTATWLRLAALWRQHGGPRRLRHLLRGRRHGRTAELQLHSVPGQRDGHRRGERRAQPNARGFLARRSGWRIGRLGHLGAAATRGAARPRPAMEHRHPAAAIQPYRAGRRLCGHHRRPSDGGREHQPAAGGCRQRAGTTALPSVRQPVGADAGAVERLPGAADQAAAAAGAGALVSRLVHLLRVDPPGARTGDWRQLHLRTATAAVGHPAPVQRQLRLRAAVWQGTPVPVECRRCDQRHCRWMAVPEHHQLPQRAAVYADHLSRRGQHRRGWTAAEPDRLGRAEDPTIDVWFDKTAFVVPASFTYGDSGPGILRSDHQWNVDMSLFKRFEVRNGQTFEFRAEAFNVLNSTYFAAPNTNIDTAAGGRVTSTANQARQIQFGFKYVF